MIGLVCCMLFLTLLGAYTLIAPLFVILLQICLSYYVLVRDGGGIGGVLSGGVNDARRECMHFPDHS